MYFFFPEETEKMLEQYSNCILTQYLDEKFIGKDKLLIKCCAAEKYLIPISRCDEMPFPHICATVADIEFLIREFQNFPARGEVTVMQLHRTFDKQDGQGNIEKILELKSRRIDRIFQLVRLFLLRSKRKSFKMEENTHAGPPFGASLNFGPGEWLSH